MSGINEVIAEMQLEDKQREMFLEHLINRLILVIEMQHKYSTLTEVERTVIINACNDAGEYKSKYAIKLLELLDK